MYTGMLHLHSLLRYTSLIGLVGAVLLSIVLLLNKKEPTKLLKILSLIALVSVHIQLLVGLYLYSSNSIVAAGLADLGSAMKDKTIRYWTVEHAMGNIIAILLITIGYSTAKRVEGRKKLKRIALYMGLGLLVLLLNIPWPWTQPARGW